ncbi:porin family protein [Malaciobacter marinus]|uniref:Porin family protein n=1 Tax=Malaciobacter marinus TaxID=505249 RepID=A0A347TLU6_9BACT|nr:outer membrane beta-barrel protein [Malaciobacter marinus]AXX87574.1 porin family protein [Malaciobacter marinus]PHO14461.1 hypothetical protein CPH92_11655 [Malaciobacter marinus]
MKNKIILFVLGFSLTASLYAKDSGFYIGGLIGKSKTKDYGKETFTATNIDSGYSQSIEEIDLIYGGLLGYDHYFDNFLIGLEFDGYKVDSDEKRDIQAGGANPWHYTSEINKVTSLKLRLGYLINEENLFYISIGKAKADITRKMYNTNGTTLLKELNDNVDGNLYGLGLEHFLENNLSIQIDFRYIKYDEVSFIVEDKTEYEDLTEKAFTLSFKYKF